MKIADCEYYIGMHSGGDEEIENTAEKIAEFICEAGRGDDLVICRPDGTMVLNTFGTYINRCADKDFLQELLEVLISKQLEVEAQVGLPECHCAHEADQTGPADWQEDEMQGMW